MPISNNIAVAAVGAAGAAGLAESSASVVSSSFSLILSITSSLRYLRAALTNGSPCAHALERAGN